ncbi:MAG TPA: AAA family ATPase, partial [Armatimonadota bacterium]|nr:AAA family ATPase [Armatimonadota bacterium]
QNTRPSPQTWCWRKKQGRAARAWHECAPGLRRNASRLAAGLEFLAQELKRISGQMEVVLLEKEEVQAALSSDSDALALLEEELSAAGQENIDLDTFVADAQKRVEDLSAHRESLSEELMEMSVTLASLRERKTGLEQSIRQTEALVTEIETELRNRRDEIGKQVNQSSVSIRERETLSEQQVQIEKTVSRLQSELEDLLNQRAQLSQSMSSVDTELKSLHHNRSETAELLRDCEVKEARLEVQISQTSQRLLEEYEISADEALARPEPEEVERGTATEVARLRKEIKSMGIVNTGAIQEYERIKERWEFLTTQKSDLEDARAKLQDAIREIDSGTRELFMDTFNNVAEHFDYMFKRLFGGGRTELVLTDPSNLLETGVEVIVQPPGKKLQNLLLLSGGERALTASALLFSLLMVRPSPFVMFDEVDAPLDDSNVERFAEVLREFSKDSQFIVVTHNRATMEAADTLYGVTMQEPGVSKLISVRLTDEAERKKTGQEVVFIGAE